MNCGLIFLHPKPARDVLIRNYENYLPADPEEISQWERMMRPVVVRSAQLIEGQSEPGRGRLLDIGSGYGFFLQEMKRRGWQVEGIEVSPAGRRYAQDKWGIHVYSKPLEDIGFPRNAFDVITLFYVVEHVHDPLGLLREVNRVLKPGGLVLLRWPHSTPIVRVLGPLSRKLDLYHTPYHLYDFSPRTMKRLLNLSGFEDIQTRVGGHTLPHEVPARWCSVLFSLLGEALSLLTSGHVLLPGISKTTTAFSPRRKAK